MKRQSHPAISEWLAADIPSDRCAREAPPGLILSGFSSISKYMLLYFPRELLKGWFGRLLGKQEGCVSSGRE